MSDEECIPKSVLDKYTTQIAYQAKLISFYKNSSTKNYEAYKNMRDHLLSTKKLCQTNFDKLESHVKMLEDDRIQEMKMLSQSEEECDENEKKSKSLNTGLAVICVVLGLLLAYFLITKKTT